MTMHVKVAGAWQQVKATGFYVKVAGAWQQVQKGYVKVAGVWQQFHQAAVFALPATCVDNQLNPGTATAQVVLKTDGTYTSTGIAGGNWVTPTSLAPGAYTISAHVNSGSTPSGSALDTDLALSTQRSWLITQSGTGNKFCDLLLTIKDGGGNTVLSQVCSMEANVDA